MLGILLASNTFATTDFQGIDSSPTLHNDWGDKTRREKRIGKKRKRKCKKWAKKSFAS